MNRVLQLRNAQSGAAVLKWLLTAGCKRCWKNEWRIFIINILLLWLQARILVFSGERILSPSPALFLFSFSSILSNSNSHWLHYHKIHWSFLSKHLTEIWYRLLILTKIPIWKYKKVFPTLWAADQHRVTEHLLPGHEDVTWLIIKSQNNNYLTSQVIVGYLCGDYWSILGVASAASFLSVTPPTA